MIATRFASLLTLSRLADKHDASPDARKLAAIATLDKLDAIDALNDALDDAERASAYAARRAARRAAVWSDLAAVATPRTYADPYDGDEEPTIVMVRDGKVSR